MMQEITVNKDELLTKLTENRDNHRAVFEAAIEGYRAQALSQLESLIDELKAGRSPKIKIVLPLPADHTKDYDRVIQMVKMHTGSSFRLSEYDFSSYVMDEWDWKRQFIDTSNTYAAAAVTRIYGDSDDS